MNSPLSVTSKTAQTTIEMANLLRVLAMDAVEAAQSGHPGMPMGMADVATILFTRFLKFDAATPNWPDRDRFVLSAGHGSILLYGLLYLTGYVGMPLSALKRFRRLNSPAAGHPEYDLAAGIETTTGPLGQGLANSVGMALAERLANARYGNDLVDHFTYVMAGDGCLMEGISQESIDLAGHLRLSRLILLFDDNGISIDGRTSLSGSTDQLQRFRASGWEAVQIDGHDPEAIATAIAAARMSDVPSLIACRTVIGYGAPNKQGTESVHGNPLGDKEIAATRQRLGWSEEPFVIPQALQAAWYEAGQRGVPLRQAWEARLESSGVRTAFLSAIAQKLPTGFDQVIRTVANEFAAQAPNIASRQSSQQVLAALKAILPTLIGGSADLTGSNGTKTKEMQAIQATDFRGQYVHYGVREHGMAAILNGIALHGGFIPYGGTFLVFSDYNRPAIRLAALMKLPVVHVMTHDSIGLGEDGPTHQPVEHLAALRVIPNLLVFRPADSVEVVEAWDCALRTRTMPSVLCLSRQNLPTLRVGSWSGNATARGAYVINGPETEERDITVLATGSEVALALAAAEKLTAEAIRVTVVSMPCWALFAQQSVEYRSQILGKAPRLAIEAAIGAGWERWLGEEGQFIGMTGFGASGPAADLFAHFGINVAAIIATARSMLNR